MEVSALKYSGGVGLHGRSRLLRIQSDERLSTFVRKGNTSAFEVLVARYETRLLAFCRHLLGSREDAEDVLQEVMTAAFNAIMYAPGGLPRAERELASTVVSRVNGCVYCASVHAQRFEQLAKRDDVIEQVFNDPATAGTSPREKAIVLASIDLTLTPGRVEPAQLRALRDVGLSDDEILDLVHSIAIFAWANRLMLNLGEPVG